MRARRIAENSSRITTLALKQNGLRKRLSRLANSLNYCIFTTTRANLNLLYLTTRLVLRVVKLATHNLKPNI